MKNHTTSKVDVLIIGAGPTGLMAAMWMSQLGIQTRIIDKRGTRMLNGHADGSHPRTLEILNSFGIAHELTQCGGSFGELCVWAPDDKGGINRVEASPIFGLGQSRFRPTLLHQGHLESYYMDFIFNKSGIEVERGVVSTSVDLGESGVEDSNAYPITVQLKHLRDHEMEHGQTNAHSIGDSGLYQEERGSIVGAIGRNTLKDASYQSSGKEGSTETVQAKYVIACEGSHSSTRHQLGFVNDGENTEEKWGVMDIVPITDFPDIRKQCTITSIHGSGLIIPRENGIVRVYTQLSDNDSSENATKSPIGPDTMMKISRKIFAPYKLSYSYCDWWTVFRAGRRLSEHYSWKERIFLAGDAVHSHTPKGGQGMNCSIQDAFNLGWKIAGVLKGQLPRSILKTYETERRPVAQKVLELDRDFSAMMSNKPNQGELERVFAKARYWLSGCNVQYSPSLLVSGATRPDAKLSSNLELGKRFPSYQVIRQGDACIMESQDLLKSDGRWRLMVFGGDVSRGDQLKRVNLVGEKLAASHGILSRYTPGLIKVLLFHSTPKAVQGEMSVFHDTFFPFDKKRGYDYYKVFSDVQADDLGNKLVGYHGNMDGYYGVDPERGCIVVTRPDQYIGYIGSLENIAALEKYFSGILVAA